MEEGFLFSEEGEAGGGKLYKHRSSGKCCMKVKKDDLKCSSRNLMLQIQSLMDQTHHHLTNKQFSAGEHFCFSLLFSYLVENTVYANQLCCQIKIMVIRKTRLEPEE